MVPADKLLPPVRLTCEDCTVRLPPVAEALVELVDADTRAPLVMVSWGVLRSTSPAIPVLDASAVADRMPLPLMVTDSGAVTVRVPPLPAPEVEADICEPFWNNTDKVCPPS